MAITDYHRAIFDFLETYREEHPEVKLTYALRQKNTEGRPRNQYLFIGNDRYIAIGLYAPQNSKTKTKSIGLVCHYDSATDTIKKCSLEIVYDDPKLYDYRSIYEQVIQKINTNNFRRFSDRRYELIYEGADWQTNLLTYLTIHKPIIDEIIQLAGAIEMFQIPVADLEESVKMTNQPIVETPLPDSEYTWVPFYKEMCSKVLQLKVADLISLVKRVLKIQRLIGLQDKDAEGNKIDLTNIDPYTFLSFINRGSDEKRLAVLAQLKELLSIESQAPADLSGLYTDQNRWMWLFGYLFERQPDDIDKLWVLYRQVHENKVSENLFNEVIKIAKLTAAKLSESFYAQNPDLYFPINSRTKVWLKKRSLPFRYTSYTEYQAMIAAVRQHDSRPFYTIAAEAYQEASMSVIDREEINYWVFQGNLTQFQIIKALEDKALRTWRVSAHADRIKVGDRIILWVSGPEAGCYALAEIISEIYFGVDEAGERYHQTKAPDIAASQRVKIEILENLWDRPVLQTQLRGFAAFSDFNGGKQGTNFRATREQYEAIRTISQADMRRFWKYSSGSQAVRWSEDLRGRVMAIDFSNYDTGSLDQYNSQMELDNHLGKIENVSNETWNMILFKNASIGDVVFANRGRNAVVGIGVISGPYQYRGDVPYNRHFRTVDWLANQEWNYTPNQFSGKQSLFRADTFSPTRLGLKILEEYVKQYPQYRPVFEKYDLLTPNDSVSKQMILASQYSKNIILYGPPGTGKTYETIDLAVNIIDGSKNDDHKINKVRFDQLRKEGQIEFVTFHQNYTYEDFVIGLKPDVDSEILKFGQREGIFYKMAKRAKGNFEASIDRNPKISQLSFKKAFDKFIKAVKEGNEIQLETATGNKLLITDYHEKYGALWIKTLSTQKRQHISVITLGEIYRGLKGIEEEGPYCEAIVRAIQDKSIYESMLEPVELKKYVLIIDEINRANMSRVFGELITLLEDDKRLGGENELTVTLPSGELFSVPPNLYLIGTMNTADKSLALLDIALRRRFEFIGKYPNYAVLNSPAKELLERLNQVILTHKKSADFLIGHAYFMSEPVQPLKYILDNRIIPLLLEYFNGRDDMVEKVLREAGISFCRNELTYQIEANG